MKITTPAPADLAQLPHLVPRTSARTSGHQAPLCLRAFVCAVPSAGKAFPAPSRSQIPLTSTTRHLLQKLFLDPSSTPHAGHAVIIGAGGSAVPARIRLLIPAGPISDGGGSTDFSCLYDFKQPLHSGCMETPAGAGSRFHADSSRGKLPCYAPRDLRVGFFFFSGFSCL